jgi:hypothetical protein
MGARGAGGCSAEKTPPAEFPQISQSILSIRRDIPKIRKSPMSSHKENCMKLFTKVALVLVTLCLLVSDASAGHRGCRGHRHGHRGHGHHGCCG